jgi:hypothetical protein
MGIGFCLQPLCYRTGICSTARNRPVAIPKHFLDQMGDWVVGIDTQLIPQHPLFSHVWLALFACLPVQLYTLSLYYYFLDTNTCPGPTIFLSQTRIAIQAVQINFLQPRVICQES